MQHESSTIVSNGLRKFSNKIWSPLFCCLITLLMSSTALGEVLKCPKQDSPHMIAMHYQLFTAYQTGFDGYEVSCELQCFSKEICQRDCQAKKALEYLQKQMTKLVANFKGQCQSLTNTCMNQCLDQGPQCNQACSGS